MSAILDKWRDLRLRVVSAIAMLGIACFIWFLGDEAFAVLLGCVSGVMFWELQNMHNPRRNTVPFLTAGVFGVLVAVSHWLLSLRDMMGGWNQLTPMLWIALIILAIATLNSRRGQGIVFVYGAVLAFVGLVLETLLRLDSLMLLLVLSTVILTDIAGYFFGRYLGGPKFWPSISPKKTWSGIVGGWVVSLGLGAYVAISLKLGVLVVLAFGVMSFGSQLGDIAESAMKRRAGVKDSSDLIPGHGGFLDRFDGVIGAALAWMLVSIFVLEALSRYGIIH